jgi:hypothetical protein
MWKKYCKTGQATDDTAGILQNMRFVCWIPKATNTHSEYVMFIAVPLQQWFRERASMLRYSTLPVLYVVLLQLSRTIE